MEDKNLNKIRHYKASWKTFFDWLNSKGAKADPYEGTILKYPEERPSPKNLPYQDFETYSKSNKNKEIN